MPSTGETYNPWRLFIGCIIPNPIARSTELSPTAKLIFGKLCQFAGENGQAYPSYSTLAKEVGVERRQAMRGVKELVSFGLIRPVGRVKGNGGFVSNTYVFLWHRIFFSDEPTDSGVEKDTWGSVINVTTPRGHEGHHLVSDMTPKENHTRDKKKEENTTTDELRLLLSGTELSDIPDKGLAILIKRHGSELIMQVADIAAETWRREKMKIRNPGGYLHALCESHVVPDWYEPPEVRNARSVAAGERKSAEVRKMEEQQEFEKREARERDDYWFSLSVQDRQKYRDETRLSSPLFENLKNDFLDGIAKLNAWDSRPQMNTNAISSS